MTWYDHNTGSIWSQPWGKALVGPLKGIQLRLLPFDLVPWGTWRAEHPETLALLPPSGWYVRQRPEENFVVGLAIGDLARAYPYPVITAHKVVNDQLGSIPIVVVANAETHEVHIYVRQLSDGTILAFEKTDRGLADLQTQSIWNSGRGLATGGELRGQALRELPWISSYPADWMHFYPHSDIYEAH